MIFKTGIRPNDFKTELQDWNKVELSIRDMGELSIRNKAE